MRWKDGRRSNNVEDLRSRPATALAGGGTILLRLVAFLLRTKFGRIILLGGVVVYFGARLIGIDLLQLTTGVVPTHQTAQTLSAQDRELGEFVAVILADTEDTWRDLFAQKRQVYSEPRLVLFRNRVNSACGMAQSAMGPFYCPGDHKLYIDLAFYEDMKTHLGAPGDFAQAYVIAHEVGHHVQTLLGISAQVQQAQQKLTNVEANRLAVKQELQADCFAGIWGHFADRERGLVELGDIAEALNAAAAIGDDRLQQQTQGTVRPESFTHGTSKQRVEWFKRGYEAGTIESCNSFSKSVP